MQQKKNIISKKVKTAMVRLDQATYTRARVNMAILGDSWQGILESAILAYINIHSKKVPK